MKYEKTWIITRDGRGLTLRDCTVRLETVTVLSDDAGTSAEPRPVQKPVQHFLSVKSGGTTYQCKLVEVDEREGDLIITTRWYVTIDGGLTREREGNYLPKVTE